MLLSLFNTIGKISLFISLLFLCLVYFSTCDTIDGRPREILVEPTLLNMNDLRQRDSITLIATDVYQGGTIKKMMQGKAYREAWVTPITAPIVWIDTLLGGLTPEDKGGGDQTLSLDLVDTLGRVYSIRSVNKDPSGLIPPIAQKLGLSNIVMDGISAQHPYGSLLIPPLADAIGIIHTHPRLVFIPEQNSLGEYKSEFGNRLYFLEYEPEGHVHWTKMHSHSDFLDTDDITDLIAANPLAKVNEEMLLRARFLDIVIGDWDRHAKQWCWIMTKEGIDSTMLFHPVATDRDNVFYGIGGIIPFIINRPFCVPRLRPFEEDVDYFAGLVQEFDRYFLYHIEQVTFEKSALQVQRVLTDDLLEYAIQQLPPQLYELDGEDIIKKMKARRDKLSEYAARFYTEIQTAGAFTGPLKGSTGYKKKFGDKDRK